MFDFQSPTVGHEALDNPVLSSFYANWRTFSVRFGTAYALPEALGPFAAFGGASRSAREDFVALVKARKSPVIVVAEGEIAVPRGLIEQKRYCGVQMIPTGSISTDHEIQFEDLDGFDAPEMLRLAQLTKPGPFALKTYQLGGFIGLRLDGELVAMAGQRMGFPGWAEISGVCVHPDFRNRGFARQMVRAMAGRIYQSGAKPFLHTYADNAKAIALYRLLGFEVRTELNIAQMATCRD